MIRIKRALLRMFLLSMYPFIPVFWVMGVIGYGYKDHASFKDWQKSWVVSWRYYR